MSSSEMNLFASLAELLGQEMVAASQKPSNRVTYCSATCLDKECGTKWYFPQHEVSVECPNCGQRHSVADLTDYQVLGEEDQRLGIEITQLRKKFATNKRTAEQVKVNGISNFQCKLLSPLLSTYGMGKDDQPCSLKDLGVGHVFDCSKLANRSFSVEEKHLHVLGYGLDRSGSQRYLQDTLSQLKETNGQQDCLVPLHADGDGHCLVHAISRCLVGRELFWHALRTNLHAHLGANLTRYRNLFKDFYSVEEWEGLIAEARPDWLPPEGQSLGLCNIHVYGLANVLRRPIILLDSLEGMQSSGDYSGIFLPTMCTPQECSSKDSHGVLKPNPPLVIAWSNSGRNHFIPLTPVKGRPIPKLPPTLLPKVWGLEDDLLSRYVDISEDGSVEVYGGKELGERYLLRLVKCMQQLFLEKNKVSSALVGDVDHYVLKVAGYVGVSSEATIWTTHSAVDEGRLFRCLICSALTLVPADSLRKGGSVYQKAARESKLVEGAKLSFPFDGIVAKYDGEADCLLLLEVKCYMCSHVTRRVLGDGTILYENGDRTQTPSTSGRCGCGYMHYWDGKEYDNLPERLPVNLSWGGKNIKVVVHWFQYEADVSRNSNVYQVASKIVNSHYPGEFGSDHMVQQVADHILKITADNPRMEQVVGLHPDQQQTTPTSEGVSNLSQNTSALTNALPAVSGGGGGGGGGGEREVDITPASKIILTGQKSRTLHKEELGMSETEKGLRRRVQENARSAQNLSKKKTKISQATPTSDCISPVATSRTVPATKATPSGQSSEKRIRVTTSDGRTCDLTLSNDTTFAQLQEAIQKELKILPSQQKLRSGFPPRELAPPNDPTLPVELRNGEKVSVDIVSVSWSGEVGLEVTKETVTPNTLPSLEEIEFQIENAEALSTFIQQMMEGKEMEWKIAENQPQMFQRGGRYYSQVMSQFGTSNVQDNSHIQFTELPNKLFAYNASADSIELCLGSKHVPAHIPIRPLTSEEELSAVTVATEGYCEEHMKTGSNKQTSSSPQIKAFSGKGHILSSATPSSASSATPSSASSASQLRARLDEFAGQVRELEQSRVGQDRTERSSQLESHSNQLELPVAGSSNERSADERLQSIHNVQVLAEAKLIALRGDEASLKQLVLALNKKLVEVEGSDDGGTNVQHIVTKLEEQLLQASNNLRKVQDDIAEFSKFQQH